MKKSHLIVAAFFAAALFGPSIGTGYLSAQEPQTFAVTAEDLEPERVYSPFADRNYPDEVLFGDTHFHTDLSFDAGLVGTSSGFLFMRNLRSNSNSVKIRVILYLFFRS